MLELQLGTNKEKQHERMLAEVVRMLDTGITRVYILVPEQSTFETELSVLRRLGNERANGGVKVLGLSRLFEQVYRDCGNRRQHMDAGGRLVAMELAAQMTQKSQGGFRAFKNLSKQPNMLKRLIDVYTMLVQQEISMAALADVANQMEDGPLKNKLNDLSAIFGSYQTVCEGSKRDPSRELESVIELVSVKSWASGTAWFISDYSDFSAMQKRLIGVLLQQAAYVQVSLSTYGLDDTSPAHNLASQTARELLSIAQQNMVETEVIHATDPDDKCPLALVRRLLCDTTVINDTDRMEAQGQVQIYRDSSVYKECQHIIGAIMRAVRNDFRYKDATIVLCDYERYAPILSTVCKRYNIPVYFGSRREEIVKTPIMTAVVSAFYSATRGLQKKDVLLYLKSGLSSLSQEEVDTLESYVRMYNIHGRGWEPGEDGWMGHPDGYGLEMDEAAEERLKAINELRAKAITPILTLRDNLAAGITVAQHVDTTIAFLNEIEFSALLQARTDRLQEMGDSQSAVEIGQIVEVLSSALQQMYDVIGSITKTGDEFVEFLRLLCSAYKTASVPSVMDAVKVLDVEDARFVSSKFRYVAGAEEGAFPNIAPQPSVLSSRDVDALAEFGLHLPGGTEYKSDRAYAAISTMLAGCEQSLTFSYTYDCTKADTPSYLLLRLKQVFPTLQVEAGCGVDMIPAADLMSVEMAGRVLGRIMNRPEYDDIALSIAAVPNHQMQEVAWRVMDKAKWELGGLTDNAVTDLYGKTISLTASRVDTYASCRYRFFLQYGLGVRDRQKAKLDSPVFGRFAHEVLEKTLREVESLGGFRAISDDQLQSIAKKHIEDYTALKLRGLDSQPERYIYLYKRNCREIITILNNICAEFRLSKFRATEFEFGFGGEKHDLPGILVEGEKGRGIYTGIADRIDTCTVDGKDYYRICDYKTGSTHTLEMSDILQGLSLQLLMYQAALHKAGYKVSSEAAPPADSAGILYIPAKAGIVAMPTKPTTAQAVKTERDKMLQRRGMLLNDKAVIHAMEELNAEGKHEFLPVRFAADGSLKGDLCSKEQMGYLDDYTMHMMMTALDGIASGNIEANPISHGTTRTSCTYCPMRLACHKDACGTQYRYRAKVTEKEFWEQVEKVVRKDKTENKGGEGLGKGPQPIE